MHTSGLLRLLLVLILPISLERFLSCLFRQCVNIYFVGTNAIVFTTIFFAVAPILIRSTDWRCWCCECMSFHIRGDQRFISLTKVDAEAAQEILPGILLG